MSNIDCIKEKNFSTFKWIDIYNPKKHQLEEISKNFNLNKTLVFDSLQEGHLPKFERLEDGYFIILRSFTTNHKFKNSVVSFSNKIAFFIQNKSIITIHTKQFSFLENIPSAIETKEKLLLYIINNMINSYESPLLEQSRQIDKFEEIIFVKNAANISLENLYYQKSKARIMKKLLLLSQQTINHLEVEKKNEMELVDIKDTLTSFILFYDEIFEDTNALLNYYLSITAQKNNDVMKLLTVFSAFFLPLTFIVGVYGMNFDYMPELKMHYGYHAVLLFMFITCLVIFIWFKRKKFL